MKRLPSPAVKRLRTRAQFDAVLAAGTVSRTPHFVLHRLALDAAPPPTGPASEATQALFAVDEPLIGVMVPKRWARRAVTRNGIKRQVYAVSASFEPRLPAAAHVVRLRVAFARDEFTSAWSDALKHAVRGELLQLFERASTAVGRPSRAGGNPRGGAA